MTAKDTKKSAGKGGGGGGSSGSGSGSGSGKKDKSTGSPFDKLRDVKAKMAKEEEARTAAKAPTTAPAGKRPFASPAPSAARPGRPAPLAAQTAESAEEDRLSFHRMMSGVTPLDAKQGRVSVTETPKASELARPRAADAASAAQREAEEVHAHLRDLVEGNQRFEVQDDGRRVEGRRVDLPREVLRKLRHGTMPIDARIDLHGLGAHEAREAVSAFLRDKRVAGERCVLIVHGKGDHSPRGQPVLRGEISAWLSQGPASEHVAAFATADGSDGGEGAVYVLIRR